MDEQFLQVPEPLVPWREIDLSKSVQHLRQDTYRDMFKMALVIETQITQELMKRMDASGLRYEIIRLVMDDIRKKLIRELG